MCRPFKVQVTKNVYRKAEQPSACITNILIDMFYALDKNIKTQGLSQFFTEAVY